MGLTAVDPALLIYQSTDWRIRANRCYERVEKLLLHRRFVREFQQHFAMSTPLSSAILEHFPWHADFGEIPELRDLRHVILEDFSRLEMIDGGEGCEVELASKQITCENIDDPVVRHAWEKLLAGCALFTDGSDSPRIATWAPVPENPPPPQTDLIVLCDRVVEPEMHSLRVVWDEDSWHADLALTDWWPDKGLGDEAFKSLRRFRVSRFWRVHYRIEKGSVILLEFGPHDMGM